MSKIVIYYKQDGQTSVHCRYPLPLEFMANIFLRLILYRIYGITKRQRGKLLKSLVRCWKQQLKITTIMKLEFNMGKFPAANDTTNQSGASLSA